MNAKEQECQEEEEKYKILKEKLQQMELQGGDEMYGYCYRTFQITENKKYMILKMYSAGIMDFSLGKIFTENK